MLSPLSLTVAPLELGSPSVMDLALFKKYLRVTFTDDDTLLETMMLGAVQAFEDATHRTVYSRAHTWVLRDLPRGHDPSIRLPRGVTRSVQRIAVTTASGVVDLYGPTSGVSPAGADWTEDLTSEEGGVLYPANGVWPAVQPETAAPVVISYTAGWAADELPQALLLALMYGTQVAYDDFRGGVLPGQQQVSLGALETLRSPYRLSRWY